MGRDPEKSSERPRRSEESRRARVYLAGLAWLEGYADGDAWRLLDTDEVVALDGTRISKARRAARTVLREHPVTLRELVGDVERWWQIIDAKLAWLSARESGKPATFDPAALLPPRVQRTFAQLHRGRLGEAAVRVATAWLAEPERVEATLAWLAAHESALAPLAELGHVQEIGFERLATTLARLALAGDSGKAKAVREAGVSALIALVALDVPDCDIALDVTRNLESRLLGQKPKAKPVAPRSGPKVVRWILSVASRETATRQRVLALVAPSQIAEALEHWRTWEVEHAAVFERATDLIGHVFDARDRAPHVQRLITKLIAARDNAPPIVELTALLREIDLLATDGYVRFHAAIVRLVTALPEAVPAAGRAHMLVHLARMAASVEREHRIEWFWDELAAALERGAPPGLLGPWQSVLDGTKRTWVDHSVIEAARRRPDLQRVIRTLGERARRGPASASELQSLAMWLAAGLPEAAAHDLLERLRDSGCDFWLDIARAVVSLSDGTAADVAVVAVAMRDVVEGLEWKAQRNLAAYVEYEAKRGAGWLVRNALVAKQRARLSEVANLVTVLPAARRPRWLVPESSKWIARYPSALSTALRRLAMVDPDAEQTAAKRLGDDLPDPAALRREIAALRARGATGSAAKRLANLEKRLAAPKLPSAARLANLAERIETTARDLGLARLADEATRIGAEGFNRAFGLAAWPDWAEPADRAQAATLREILFALLRLDGDREVIGRLLRLRGGPPPWDLRDEPANRRFLDKMRAANVAPEPWLDTTPRVVRTPTGDISLALAGDPLDVFAMGWHFGTCLSPNGGNFFSVVANAADINKRVLYARRDGRVIGRCLFALTDAFAILTFHPYCHETIDFSSLVSEYAVDLASRMNTIAVARGSVSTLVARDWYDDGSRDLVGRFGGLEESFDISRVPPDQLVAKLREAFGRDLDDVTLPIILGHPSLRRQPRFLAPLVPFVLASQVSQIRIEAAQLAIHDNDLALADRLLGDHGHAIAFDDHGSRYGEVLARLRPSETLATLRRTRSREVRRWSEDRAERIALAGVALEALARPRQAAAMYRLAAKTETWIAETMRERLAALGEPVEGDVAD
ncbi:MAG: hypothetical protein HOV81_01400 [Kofleriaceae bacterium]|nr:hypothetical protein [Kofleriaceae bacterium]